MSVKVIGYVNSYPKIKNAGITTVSKITNINGLMVVPNAGIDDEKFPFVKANFVLLPFASICFNWLNANAKSY